MRPIPHFSARVLIALAALCVIALLHVDQRRAQAGVLETLRDRVVSQLVEASRQYAAAFAHDEAIATIHLALLLDPDNPQLYIERGQRLLLLYEWDRALADFNSAITLDPDFADAYYYRGLLYASVPEGDTARALALADFHAYLNRTPNGARADAARRYVVQLEAQLETRG